MCHVGLSVCLCTVCVCILRRQKRVSNPLELKLEAVVSP